MIKAKKKTELSNFKKDEFESSEREREREFLLKVSKVLKAIGEYRKTRILSETKELEVTKDDKKIKVRKILRKSSIK